MHCKKSSSRPLALVPDHLALVLEVGLTVVAVGVIVLVGLQQSVGAEEEAADFAFHGLKRNEKK